MEQNKNVFGVILAGGSGSRLWPLSREMYPKQLLKLSQDKTLYQSTFLRLSEIIPAKNITTVTNIKHSVDIKMQIAELFSGNSNDFNVIIEPVGRNTAPAIGLASMFILKKMAEEDNDPVIIVAPSDHLIQCRQKFTDAVLNGIKLAEAGFIVTFGIKPDKPDTGYGYINTLKENKSSGIINDALKVKEFKEKPDADTAKKYLEQGCYYWNSGIFMFKASTILNELKKYKPEIFDILDNTEFVPTGPTVKFEDYSKLPDISIDYAVMEYSDLITLIPIDCGWNDMGSWQAIYDIAVKDERNNFISGNVIDIESQNSLIYGTSKLVSTIGLKDTVLIETDDAILACAKDRTQDVKKIFDILKENKNDAYLIHKTVYRPWGYYTVLQRGEGFLIKIINVNPDAKLSLQMHFHRSEHWVVLSGVAKVRKEEQEYILQQGDSIDIPTTVKHSLENPGKIELKIIEIQSGHYLEEDDIVRFEDIYGRVSQ